MSYFFENAQNLTKLGIVLREWEGTPFRVGQCEKGGGVDCVNFVHSVYVECGAMEAIQFPTYTAYGGGVAELNKLIETLNQIPSLETIWTNDLGPLSYSSLLPGDMIIISSGKAYHHLAVFDHWPVVWNAIETGSVKRADGKIGKGGVQESHLNNPEVWKRLYEIRRFLA